MKSPDDANFVEWQETPEPALPAPDGSVILELDAVSDAYLWESHNSGDGWLSYDGPVADIVQ